jgi:hypothetical protein
MFRCWSGLFFVCADPSAGTRQPHVAQHASFSCMVNFDAIGRYAHSTGGSVMTTHYLEGMSSQTSILFNFCKMSAKLQKCSSAVMTINFFFCSKAIAILYSCSLFTTGTTSVQNQHSTQRAVHSSSRQFVWLSEMLLSHCVHHAHRLQEPSTVLWYGAWLWIIAAIQVGSTIPHYIFF